MRHWKNRTCAEHVQIVIDILIEPRRMPRKLERARLIETMRDILERCDDDGDGDDAVGDRGAGEARDRA
jgi:hypothetical protein